MLLKVDEANQEALQRVAECGERAKAARTPREREEWQLIEASWLSLAHSREFSGRLESFRAYLKNRERELADRYGVLGADSAKCDTELVAACAVAHASSGAGIDLPTIDLSKDAAEPSGRLADGPELRSMISTEELKQRPSRLPDYAAEIQALVALNQSMAVSPEGILQRLVETALVLCRGQTAGISLLEDADQKKNFHWRALAGVWAPHLNGGTPRDFGPCGVVLDRNAPQICRHPELEFPYFAEAPPFVEDGLLIPFYLGGEAVGTVWVLSHDQHRFDSEDLRILTTLGTFASAAYQMYLASKAAQQFAAIVASSGDAIISTDLEGVIQSWNVGAERIYGYARAEALGQSITMLFPADRIDEYSKILHRIQRGERIERYETVRRRKDASLIELSLTLSPITDITGKVIGASKIGHDITERRKAQRLRELHFREMDHRIRNLFALAESVVTLSAKSAQTPNEMASHARVRLAALARAHALTLPKQVSGSDDAQRATTLHALIRVVVAPYENVETLRRVVISGPDVSIAPRLVNSFALALHEFATNAAKYGALSAPDGRIEIACSEANDLYSFVWTEHGGPHVDKQPDGEGFGSELARTTIVGQLSGAFSREWKADGLAIRLSVARHKLT